MPGSADTPSHIANNSDNSFAADTPAIKRMRQAEQILALILTVIAICLNAINFSNAGGLWRDEVNSINLATLPDLTQLWSSLQYDSFPVVHYLAIRYWAQLFGSADTSLRLLGLTIGILLIGALWYKAIGLGSRTPLISLLLIGLNPLMIRFLDALRPNGLAALATVLAFTAVWRTLRRTDYKHLAVTTVILVICVQTLFQDAILILAIGIAAIATGLRQGGPRRAGLMAIPFVIAALTLIPYFGNLQKAAQWSPVAMGPPDEKMLLPGLLRLVNAPFPWMGWLWLALAVTATLSILWQIKRRTLADEKELQSKELSFYCGVTMVSAAALFMLFLAKGVGISPRAWHYMPLLVLLAISAEPLLEQCLEGRRWRFGLFLLIAGSTVATLYHSTQQLQARVTSIDLIAAGVAREAAPNDLIVLMPWYYGVSFSRYYQGNAPWISFPTLKENSLHRYDLLKEKMLQPESIKSDVATILAALQQGGKVWLIGSALAMLPGMKFSLLPPAPLPQSGWSSAPYLTNWSMYLMTALADHSVDGEQLFINSPSILISMEAPAITVFQGYRQ